MLIKLLSFVWQVIKPARVEHTHYNHTRTKSTTRELEPFISGYNVVYRVLYISQHPHHFPPASFLTLLWHIAKLLTTILNMVHIFTIAHPFTLESAVQVNCNHGNVGAAAFVSTKAKTKIEKLGSRFQLLTHSIPFQSI